MLNYKYLWKLLEFVVRDNPLPELSELTTTFTETEDDQVSLTAYQLFGETELTCEFQNYILSLNRAYLSVTAEGMKMITETRFNYLVRSPVSEQSHKVERSISSAAESAVGLDANVSTTNSKPKIGAGVFGSKKNTNKDSSIVAVETKESAQFKRVVARGDSTWEIRGMVGVDPILDGAYLAGEELARFERYSMNHANRTYAQVTTFAKQRDINVNTLDGKKLGRLGPQKNRTKSRIHDILIAKFIHTEVNPQLKYAGHVQLSMTEYENE